MKTVLDIVFWFFRTVIHPITSHEYHCVKSSAYWRIDHFENVETYKCDCGAHYTTTGRVRDIR